MVLTISRRETPAHHTQWWIDFTESAYPWFRHHRPRLRPVRSDVLGGGGGEYEFWMGVVRGQPLTRPLYPLVVSGRPVLFDRSSAFQLLTPAGLAAVTWRYP